ncbi:unknown [Plutella xylostella multiple nucleopolyhedrovirus]|uniref:Ac124 n=1 Tax=Plutella xylostella multiple nucleopolyhedrovirus TaxID=379891 RepID=Q0GYA1_9ABAC|nr:unknown [Plutella xylostella multiple nucleopolyhedrovirus]
MGLFACCTKYTRLSTDTKMKFPYVALSYINVTLCTYTAMLVGYMVTFNDSSELKYLQYWLLLSFLMSVVLNAPTLWTMLKTTEAHEVIYEMKLFHAMYFSNVLLNYVVFLDNQMGTNFVFVNNLIHCCVLFMIFVELLILLGHTMGTYTDYQYVKSCYMVILFVSVMSVTIVMGLECLKTKLIDNSLMFNAFVCALYIVIAIMWSLKNNLTNFHVSNLQNIQVVPFSYNDPPPPFSNIVIDDIKNKK